jgi:hypothetical protein
LENNKQVAEGAQVLRVYGASVSSVKKDLEQITSTQIGRKNIYTKETGRITVTPEIFTSAECCDPGGGCGGSSGGGEGELICLLVIAVVMALVAIIWTAVMIAFSILTIGGFLTRRYRTLLVIEKPNRELLGKLVVSITRHGGVVDYPWGIDEYDSWMKRTFGLFMRLKILRQVSLFVGLCWGLIEIWYKLNNILYDIDYNLWPFRFIMVAIFLPLLFSGPVLEFRFNNAQNASEEVLYRLLTENPSFNPEYPMTFEEEPQIIGGMSTAAIRKLKEPPKDE